MGRTELQGSVKFDAATPRLDALRNAIGEKLHVEPGLVVVNHVYSAYGQRAAVVHAYAYKDAKAKDLFTIIPKKKLKADAKVKFDAVRKAAADAQEAAKIAEAHKEEASKAE